MTDTSNQHNICSEVVLCNRWAFLKNVHIQLLPDKSVTRLNQRFPSIILPVICRCRKCEVGCRTQCFHPTMDTCLNSTYWEFHQRSHLDQATNKSKVVQSLQLPHTKTIKTSWFLILKWRSSRSGHWQQLTEIFLHHIHKLTRPPKSSKKVAEMRLISASTVKLSGLVTFLKSARSRASLFGGRLRPGLGKNVLAWKE